MIGRWFVGFVVFVGYLCLGAFVFYRIERKEEEKRYFLEILEKLELKGKRLSASKKRLGSPSPGAGDPSCRLVFQSASPKKKKKIDPNSLYIIFFSCPFKTDVSLYLDTQVLPRRASYTTAAQFGNRCRIIISPHRKRTNSAYFLDFARYYIIARVEYIYIYIRVWVFFFGRAAKFYSQFVSVVSPIERARGIKCPTRDKIEIQQVVYLFE